MYPAEVKSQDQVFQTMATIEVDAKDLARLCDMADAFADELDDPDYDLIERNRAKVMTETDILD